MTDVQELRALLDAASPRPWYASNDAEPVRVVAGVMSAYHRPDSLFICGHNAGGYARPVSHADAALIAAAVNALPELLDEVERLRVKADAADALQTEAARLRSDLDIERAQSAEFVKEIERLKAGIADAERWAAHSAAGEVAAIGVINRAVSDMLRIPVSIEALAVSAIRQNLQDFRPSVAGSKMLGRLHAIEAERDSLRAEVERLRARRAEMCECVNHGEINANYTDDDCPRCGGSGGVITEGEK